MLPQTDPPSALETCKHCAANKSEKHITFGKFVIQLNDQQLLDAMQDQCC